MSKEKRRINPFTVAQAYRRIYTSAFSHLPLIPKLCVIPGRAVAGDYNLSENHDDWHHELCGFFEIETFKIIIFPDNHETYSDVFGTIVHELTHVEQFHRKQPLTHGPRFSRRMRKLARRVRFEELHPKILDAE